MILSKNQDTMMKTSFTMNFLFTADDSLTELPLETNETVAVPKEESDSKTTIVVR